MNVVIIFSAIVIWAVIHSLLASLPAKRLARNVFGDGGARAYRLGYNLFAVLSFVPILALVRLLPDRVLYAVKAPWLFAMLLGQAAAAFLLLLALLQTGALQFMGLRQLADGEASGKLIVQGFYRLVRHPLYLFGLLILWLTPYMTVNMLTAYVLLTLYLFVGAMFEERRLIREYGAEYTYYRATTPMIIPRFKRGRPAGKPAGGSGK